MKVADLLVKEEKLQKAKEDKVAFCYSFEMEKKKTKSKYHESINQSLIDDYQRSYRHAKKGKTPAISMGDAEESNTSSTKRSKERNEVQSKDSTT